MIGFFFKQKTAYEMRISDWSSDVCSSDLDKAPNNRVYAIFQWLRQIWLSLRSHYPDTIPRCLPLPYSIDLSCRQVSLVQKWLSQNQGDRSRYKRGLNKSNFRRLSACFSQASPTSAWLARTAPPRLLRSEERRLGKECISTC